jgi:cytochrome c peroxidase
MPILNPDEMAIPHKEFLVDRHRKDTNYARLFKEAFPDESQPVRYDNLTKAIRAFERTLLTPSRFLFFYERGPGCAYNYRKKRV